MCSVSLLVFARQQSCRDYNQLWLVYKLCTGPSDLNVEGQVMAKRILKEYGSTVRDALQGMKSSEKYGAMFVKPLKAHLTW